MATLENTYIDDTYKDLLQVSNSNAGVDGTLRSVSDGEGTTSALQISTTGVKSTGTFNTVGVATLATANISAGTITGITDLALADGGTNASLVASNGGIFYSTATAGAILSGTATAGKALLSGSSTTPIWSTPTYPSASGTAGKVLRADGTNNVYSTSTFADTYTASNLLYSNGSNAVTGLTTGNNGVLITSGAGVPSISSTIPSATQLNITSLGTVTTGVWTGTTIAVANGGTGVISSKPVIQTVTNYVSSVTTGSTVIPFDDTIPQNTEGDLYLTVTITPKNSANKLLIECLIYLANTAAGNQNLIAALFQDSTANALAVGSTFTAVASSVVPVRLSLTMDAGTTSATTFNIRGGGSAAGTTTRNGNSGTRLFGGVLYSSLRVTEYTT